ncbi:MAG: hypothetical protein WCK18_17655 [Prolixibacteraceae bacterium]|jgi:hypothetical protein
MNIKEKIVLSKQVNSLTLHREGLFYKCYNEDAMVFVKQIKSYKVLSKFIKSAGEEVLCIGFPVSELEKGRITTELIAGAIGATKTQQLEKQVVFNIENKDLKKNFASWRIEIIEQNKNIIPAKINDYTPTNKDVLIRMIQEFDLANSTPMQGLMFVQELKTHMQYNNEN